MTFDSKQERRRFMKTARKLPLFLIASFTAVVLSAQQPTPPAPGMKKPGTVAEGEMDESRMMAMHKEMMAKMEMMDSRLDDLVKKMNAAKGSGKVDATAAVVNELVTQRKAMRQQMMSMQPEMMRHMMGHMQMGMMKGMAECPMMKGMAAPPETKKPAADEHSQHHPE
jgi:hypothetical protein